VKGKGFQVTGYNDIRFRAQGSMVQGRRIAGAGGLTHGADGIEGGRGRTVDGGGEGLRGGGCLARRREEVMVGFQLPHERCEGYGLGWYARRGGRQGGERAMW